MRLAACLAGWLTCLPVAKALFWKTLAPALADSQKASSDLCASADRLKPLPPPLLASQANRTHPGASHSGANVFYHWSNKLSDTRWFVKFLVQIYSCAVKITQPARNTKESCIYLITSWYGHFHHSYISLTGHITKNSQCYMTEGTPWPMNSRVHPHCQCGPNQFLED